MMTIGPAELVNSPGYSAIVQASTGQDSRAWAAELTWNISHEHLDP